MSNRTVLRNDEVVSGPIFEEQCPTARKVLENALRVYKVLLHIGDGIKSQQESETIRLSASVEQIMSEHNKTYNMTTDKDRIHRYVNALAYMGLVKKLDISDLTSEEYKILTIHEKAYATDRFKQHIQYYDIPYLHDEDLLNIEANARRWKEHNYSIRSFGYELLYRTEGYDVAASIFPRYKQEGFSGTNGKPIRRTTTTESDNRTYMILDFIMKNINEKGYCMYRDIISGLGIRDRHVNKSLPSILQDYGLRRVFLNNQLKKSLNIPFDGHPSLLIPEAIYLGTEK